MPPAEKNVKRTHPVETNEEQLLHPSELFEDSKPMRRDYVALQAAVTMLRTDRELRWCIERGWEFADAFLEEEKQSRGRMQRKIDELTSRVSALISMNNQQEDEIKALRKQLETR